MIVDSHAHLTYKGLREEVDQVLARARQNGVGGMITVGIDAADSHAAVELASKHPDVWATVGVHPHDTEAMTDADLAALADLSRDPNVVGWGETGLDFFRDHSPRDVQRKWFRAQAATARELGLPLVVHDRDAHEECLRVIEDEAKKGLRGVMHCFSGDLDFARRVLKTGFYISIPGTVTYPKNTELQEVVRGVELERCLLETDCPFLTPVPKRGKRNEPALLRHTAEFVAGLRGIAVEDVARITTRAANELFGLGLEEPTLLAYPIRRSLYLNVTDRCTNRCSFCAKNKSSVVKGHDLKLDHEPTAMELLAAVEEQGGAGAWDEVVFCGFGEPLLRLDLVVQTARELRARGAKRIRVNTDGLASLVHDRDVVAELAGVVDSVSVSLNAPDAESYERLCRPQKPGAFEALKEFIRQAAAALPQVTATAVAVPGLDMAACERVARGLGVEFRPREYNEVG